MKHGRGFYGRYVSAGVNVWTLFELFGGLNRRFLLLSRRCFQCFESAGSYGEKPPRSASSEEPSGRAQGWSRRADGPEGAAEGRNTDAQGQRTDVDFNNLGLME